MEGLWQITIALSNDLLRPPLQTDGRTDRRTTCNHNTAICTKGFALSQSQSGTVQTLTVFSSFFFRDNVYTTKRQKGEGHFLYTNNKRQVVVVVVVVESLK